MPDFTYVGVSFPNSSRIYHYKTQDDFEQGDTALVNTAQGYQVVRVRFVDCKIEPIEGIRYKFTTKVNVEGL